MRRFTRPTLHWLLWLVVALLPLRGWAQAQMALPVTTMVATAGVAGVADAPRHLADAAASPCHGQGADPETATSHDGTCSLCVVCHAGLGLSAAPKLHLPDLPEVLPAAMPSTGLPDGAPSDLFRPPRHPA